MGRYSGKITHSFSSDPSRPTFDETIQTMRLMILKFYLENIPTYEGKAYIINALKQSGILKS